jgi:hypothetical protein
MIFFTLIDILPYVMTDITSPRRDTKNRLIGAIMEKLAASGNLGLLH